MLPWQRRIREHKRQLKIKAFLGALTIYSCVVFAIFFSSYKPAQRVHIAIHQSGKGIPSAVVFMQRPPKKQAPTTSAHKKSPVQNKQVVKKVPKNIPKPQQQPKLKPKPKKKVIKKESVQKKPTIKPKIKEPTKKIKSQQEMSKIEKKLAKGKPKVAPPKKIEPKSKPQEKKPQKKVEPKKDPIKKQEPQQPEKVVQPVSQKEIQTEQREPAVQEVPDIAELYVGEGYDQGSKAQIALSRAVARTWKPPHGLVDDLSSQLLVQIAQDGKIHDVTIEKKSGVLAYDLSARAALWRVEYPQEFWGKTVSILFGPQ